MLLKVVLIAAPFLFVCSIQQIVVRLLARKDGFQPINYNLQDVGPALISYRWGSVVINKGTRWGRVVTITLFKRHIHLKLMALFGGGELIIPLQGASYSFSRWIRGELVDITIDGKTYRFGGSITQAVKQHYC